MVLSWKQNTCISSSLNGVADAMSRNKADHVASAISQIPRCHVQNSCNAL